MTAKDYLDYIVNEIHRTIVATVDDEGLNEFVFPHSKGQRLL